MKIIEPQSIYLDPNNMTAYEFMEKIGRVCYKSENNISEGSAEKFVMAMKKSNHTAMLEHSHIILLVDYGVGLTFINALHNCDITQDNLSVRLSNFFNISKCGSDFIISGSFRSFLACSKPEFLDNIDYTNSFGVYVILNRLAEEYPELFDKVMTNPDNPNSFFCKNYVKILSRNDLTKYAKSHCDNAKEANHIISKHLTHSVLFICDRGVTHEFARHRLASFAQESTRYCNYSKDKFENSITVILPNELKVNYDEYSCWKHACEVSEKEYFNLLELGVKPQIARNVLPTSLKTEMVITATEEEWQHIMNLRYHGTTGAPHPQIKQSMELIREELLEQSNRRIH